MNCITCGKNFSRKDNLTKHVTSGKWGRKMLDRFRCVDFPYTYARKEDLQKHRARSHPIVYERSDLPEALLCSRCELPFRGELPLKKHELKCGVKVSRQRGSGGGVRESGDANGFTMVSNALGGNVHTYRHDFNGDRQDVLSELEAVMREGAEFVTSLADTVKYSYCLSAVFCKAVDPEIHNADDPAYFWSEQVIMNSLHFDMFFKLSFGYFLEIFR